MLITTITTIGFKLPEENELMQKFILEHDITEWREDYNSNFACFTKCTYNTVTSTYNTAAIKEH